MKKRIISLLTVMTIITAMIQMPVFAAEETVSENISNDQLEGDLYLPSDEEAGEFKLEDEYIENEPNEDMSVSQLDNVNYESTADIDNSSDIELTATSYTYENLTYRINDDNTINITGTADGVTNIKIPSKINGMNVTTITRINDIVTDLEVPDSVIDIKEAALRLTEWYKSQPDGIVYAGKVAYKYKGTLPQSVTVKAGTLGIADRAFGGYTSKDLPNIYLPEGLIHIGKEAFFNNRSLTSIDIPKSVSYIGFDAFENCKSLTSINVDDSNQYYSDDNGILYDKDQTCAIYCPIKKELLNYTLPHTVKKIEANAFEQCSIKNITIPEGVTNVGRDAFANSTILETVYVPGSITTFDSIVGGVNYDYQNCRMFYECTSLREVNIGYGLQEIGYYMFYGCTSLNEISIPDSVSVLGICAFADCSSLPQVYMPEGIKEIPSSVYSDCSSVTEVVIPKTVTKIGVGAFSGTSISELIIPETVTQIGLGAFSETPIKEITIPENITLLGGDTFYNCPYLTTVNYNAINCTTNGGGKDMSHPMSVFEGSNNLKQVNIGNKVHKLENYLFEGCEGLTSLTIPQNVTDVGDIFSDKTSATIYGYNGSAAQTYAQSRNFTFIAIDPQVVSTPTISTSNIVGGKSVSISCSTSGATIYYTTNGSTPTTSSNRYNGAISLTSAGTTTIKAIAVKSGYNNSSVATRDVTVSRAATPEASPSGGTITSPTSVTLSCSTSGATIYYTTNGNTPTTRSTRYTGAINISSTTTLKAIAVASGYANSSTATYTYTYSQPTPSKEFTMLRDNYSFANTWSSFGYSRTYKIPLERYISVFGVTEGRKRYQDDGVWGGSCYGFSATSSLFFIDKLNYRQYNPTASSLFSIPAPKTPSANLTILMERYQLSQSLNTVSRERSNHYDMRDIIDAVRNFEKTGQDPIVLCMWGYGGGHAVVPYKCVTESDGSYSIYVYDNNYPSSKDRIVKINKSMTGFSYDGYTLSITYNYANTINNALSGVSLMSNEDENVASLTINSDDISITDLNGVDISNIEGAYEVIPIERDYDTSKKRYVIPNGDYIIKNKRKDIDTFEVSIANKLDYQNIKTDDLDATINVGIYSSNGRVYAYVMSAKNSNNSIESMGSNGVSKLLESVGRSLGVTASDNNSIEVVADSTVACDGTNLKVGNENEIGSTLVSTEADINDSIGDDVKYSIETKKNTLSYTNGNISGNLSLLLYNNSGNIASASIITGLYSQDGKLVSIIKKSDEILGNGSNYYDLGTINYMGLDMGKYYIKCFLWDSMDSMQPLSDAVEIEIK